MIFKFEKFRAHNGKGEKLLPHPKEKSSTKK
jgi:hypothetical protein